jgi:catechol 2,3-dioxygenase-like lactoylglutathione lyase family enzyme
MLFDSQPKQTTPTTPLRLNTVNHVGIGVKDLQRSIDFYRALTGEAPAATGNWASKGMGASTGQEKADINWATFNLGNINIDLLQANDSKPGAASYEMMQYGGLHFCFEVDDITAAVARLEAAGIELMGPPHVVSAAEDGAKEGVGTGVAYFVGPDGEYLELIAPAGPFKRRAA